MKKNKVFIIPAVVVLLLLVGGGALFYYNASKSSQTLVNNSILSTRTDPKKGNYLAAPSGYPLYTYSHDAKGVSNCNDNCARNWPPYLAPGETSHLPPGVGVIIRKDGTKQYTYNGQPLYYYIGDPTPNSSPGGVNGNGSSAGGSSSTGGAGGSGFTAGGGSGSSTGSSGGNSSSTVDNSSLYSDNSSSGAGGASGSVTGDGKDGFTMTQPSAPVIDPNPSHTPEAVYSIF